MHRSLYKLILATGFVLTMAVYWPGLSGSWLFDDYPNIVDNHGVQPADASLASLVNAALASPASDFKRPLASLSFALNYLASGLNPYGMKLTNLLIHLLNGWLIFLLARALLLSASVKNINTEAVSIPTQIGVTSALIAASWMLLPINLTGVLYVVQRMESLANVFVLAGLIGYVAGRRRMLGQTSDRVCASDSARRGVRAGLLLCVFSITVPAAVGLLFKETAVMLPLYAVLVEWILFKFQSPPLWNISSPDKASATSTAVVPAAGKIPKRDNRIALLFLVVLALPMLLGLAWLLPGLLKSQSWATRDFTLSTRLLSEARIMVDYIVWTLLPTSSGLSFYHDNFHVSTGLLSPWTTITSMLLLASLVWLVLWLRSRQPMVALGIALFLGCHLLTGTILPLELIYEHRNYFASFGLMLALMPLLLAFPTVGSGQRAVMAFPRRALLVCLLFLWAGTTAMMAFAWGNPLRLAEALAASAPDSPRAEYELGRTYIIYSRYDPSSPFTKMAYAPLERAAALPDSSILPEQALIFMNARMHLPLKDIWWDSMIGKLKARKPGVQDESSLEALSRCERERNCDLPTSRMTEAYLAAVSHPYPSARLLAIYSDFAWNMLDDHELGLRMIKEAIEGKPDEPAYRVTLIRMLVAEGHSAEAKTAFTQLQAFNVGGRVSSSLDELRQLPGLH